MRNMEDAVTGFVEAIKDSEEYRDYARERDKVRQFPELKEEIDEYRRRNYEMQSSDDTGFEHIEAFEKEYADLWEKPLAADFLAAELAFCRMMQEINLRVTESLDFE